MWESKENISNLFEMQEPWEKKVNRREELKLKRSKRLKELELERWKVKEELELKRSKLIEILDLNLSNPDEQLEFERRKLYIFEFFEMKIDTVMALNTEQEEIDK